MAPACLDFTLQNKRELCDVDVTIADMMLLAICRLAPPCF